jgi:Flp pilus assembly protein TadD
VLAGSFALILCGMSASRGLLWHDNLRLFHYAWTHDSESMHKSYIYAKALAGHGRNEEALEVLRHRSPMRYGDPLLCELEGVALINLGETEKGIARLEESLAYGETPRVYQHLAEWHVYQGDLERAEYLAHVCLESFPHHDEAMLLLAEIARLEGDYDTALENIDRCLEIEPDDIDTHLGHARILEALDQDEEAHRVLVAANGRLTPTPESLGTQAQLAMRLEDWTDAADSLERILSDDPDLVNAMIDLGYVYLQLDRVTEARTTWRRVLAIDPSNVNARTNLRATDWTIAQTTGGA